MDRNERPMKYEQFLDLVYSKRIVYVETEHGVFHYTVQVCSCERLNSLETVDC